MNANSPVERTPLESGWRRDAPVFNIVILHDDVAAGQRAMGALTTLASTLHPDALKIRPQLWRFDLLQDPDWFALALADAVNADMLIFATSSASGLPVTVENWLKLCLARKRGTDAAVLALLPAAGDPAGTESRDLQCVQGMAREAGLAFIAPEPGREKALDTASTSLRPLTTTATLRSIVVRDEFPHANHVLSRTCSYQHGGLNE